MNAAELRFRHFLGPAMAGEWMMSWHEDRHISPGVPDLHYVMKAEDPHRVGWLELKAIDVKMSATHRIKVEPSQHQYIRKWRAHMPIHFLIRVQKEIFLIDGKYHAAISEATELSTLISLAVVWSPQDSIVSALSPALRTITRI